MTVAQGASLEKPNLEVTTQRDAEDELELNQLTTQIAGLDTAELDLLVREGAVETPKRGGGGGGFSSRPGGFHSAASLEDDSGSSTESQ